MGVGNFVESIPITIPASTAIVGFGFGMTRLTTTASGSIFLNMGNRTFLSNLTLNGSTNYANIGVSVQITASVSDPITTDPAVLAPKMNNVTLLNFDQGILISGLSSSLVANAVLFNDCRTAIKITNSCFAVELANSLVNYSLISGSAVVIENYNDTPADTTVPVFFSRGNHYRYCTNAFYSSNVDQTKGTRITTLASHFTSCSYVANLNDSTNLGFNSSQTYSTVNYEFYQGYPTARFRIFNSTIDFSKVYIQPTGHENFLGAFPSKTDSGAFILQGSHPEIWLRSARAIPDEWRIRTDTGVIKFDINTHPSGNFATSHTF